MKELRILNYYTVYSYCSIGARGAKTLVFDHVTGVCFASLFGRFRDMCPKGEYTVFVSNDLRALESRKSNYCFLSKSEIINHLKRAQQIVPEFVDFTITPTVYSGYSGYEITVIIDRADRIIHKYVLTWIRYLYETCFSLALLDASKLAKLPEFRFISYANLLNIVQACFSNCYPNHNTWHAIGEMRPHEILTQKELKQKLPHAVSLNSLYAIKRINANYRLPDTEERYDLEFWKSDEKFAQARLPYYKELLKQLKNI